MLKSTARRMPMVAPNANDREPDIAATRMDGINQSLMNRAPSSDQIPGPGDQRAETVGEGSVLLVRDNEGVLRAFANTCRHRGHELLPCGAATQQKVIICPYHSWTYTLDGSLRARALARRARNRLRRVSRG